MFCHKCGSRNADQAVQCAACGESLVFDIPYAQRAPARLEDDAAMRMLLPVGRSALAIAAGYAGLFAFIPIFAPIALVLGILAIRDLKRRPGKRGMGRAVFGLIIGGLGTIVLLIVTVSLLGKS